MISYLDILNKMEEVADGISTIKSFKNSPVSEWDDEKHNVANYAILGVTCEGVEFEQGRMSYEFRVFCGDLIREDLSDRDQVWNDTLLSLHDFINHFVQSGAENSAVGFTVDYGWTAEPFTDRLDNLLTGWETTIEIAVDNTNDLCASA